MVKNGLSKTVIFVQNPYLILIGFHENAIFGTFPENHCFWWFSRTPLVYWWFSPFEKCQVFPWVYAKSAKCVKKSVKITVFDENH